MGTGRPTEGSNVSPGPAGPVLDAIPEAVVLTDPDTREVVGANDAATELFGRSRETLAGIDLRELFPEDPWRETIGGPTRTDRL